MGNIGPKGKISKSRRDKRRAQSWKIPFATLVKCDKCGEFKVPHRVCGFCGSYKKQVVIVKEAK
jgi:large subunit ribosomal protein L32